MKSFILDENPRFFYTIFVPAISVILDTDILTLHEQGKSNAEIAKQVGLTRERIRQRLFQHGIISTRHLKPHNKGRSVYPELNDPAWLTGRYSVAFMTIAEELDCSESAVRDAYKRLGIPHRTPLEAHKIAGRQFHEDYLATVKSRVPRILALLEGGLSYIEIARELGFGSNFSVQYALKQFGVKPHFGRGGRNKKVAVAVGVGGS